MPGTDPTPEEFSLFVHTAQHLLAERGGRHPAGLLLWDCWWFDAGEVPKWADRLAQANAPGWTWCPRITPGLVDLSDPETHVAQVLARA